MSEIELMKNQRKISMHVPMYVGPPVLYAMSPDALRGDPEELVVASWIVRQMNEVINFKWQV